MNLTTSYDYRKHTLLWHNALAHPLVYGTMRMALLAYLRHLKAVRESGCENAYNHYVVLYGDQPAFKRWVALHPIEWQRFADWFDSYNPADGECAYF